MAEEQDKVWYACYGSNILEERFLCYIQGGQPKGAKTEYYGCRDKSMPLAKEEIYINAELYFARYSRNWNDGGVAFVKTKFEPQVQTLGRMYLITKKQLKDVARQENSKEERPNINYEMATDRGSLILYEKSWYGNLVYLGKQSGFPIFTLTNENNEQDETKPSVEYLTTIAKGIKETHNSTAMEVVDYFMSKAGVRNNYSKDEIVSKLSTIWEN